MAGGEPFDIALRRAALSAVAGEQRAAVHEIVAVRITALPHQKLAWLKRYVSLRTSRPDHAEAVTPLLEKIVRCG